MSKNGNCYIAVPLMLLSFISIASRFSIYLFFNKYYSLAAESTKIFLPFCSYQQVYTIQYPLPRAPTVVVKEWKAHMLMFWFCWMDMTHLKDMTPDKVVINLNISFNTIKRKLAHFSE